ncbi:MAG TPA: ATP-dependent DNA helicase RecG [Bacillota bacterium]|nr:ATP-dependent DNA helicase RecG [Bacillota bacterium]
MLNRDVQAIKGVGQKIADDLYHMGIYTVEDLLFYFPYRYNVYEIKPLAELIHGDTVTIEGRIVHHPSLTFYGKKRSRLVFTVDVERVAVKAVMFNRAFAKKQLHPGDTVTLTGKWDAHRLQITVNTYKKGSMRRQSMIEPVYSLKGNMTNNRLKTIMRNALNTYIQEVEELLPNNILKTYKLPERQAALTTMHFPKNRRALKHARRRFVYEEFLLFQLKMQLLRKINRRPARNQAQNIDTAKIEDFISSFPFQLTGAQQRSLEQILTDITSEYRMNRLLQGDVGSGKTAVAAISMYAAITAGKQCAFMVPTEILAEQHVQSLTDMFGERANIQLLTGSVKGKKRKTILEDIRNREVDIVVGTHALIQSDVCFNNLGLVIIDEQHRFGVEQRRILREKGWNPDVLFMTATPIPRTLAITAFGDMDVSVIDEMPSGRKKVATYWTKENALDRVLTFIQKRIAHGEQAYVICPLIEESDKMDIQNALDLYEQLQAFYPSEINIGLMHGKLHSDEKERIMKDFAQNKIHILVATTVVEVGVNVPNATVMVIYDAERFGLAQLHQLRGRVGRGSRQSYCILIADPKGEIGKERMQIMTETNDGFELSEHDLKLRGPGDFFGNKQSGIPDFKVADMVHDYRALETARRDAEKIIELRLLEQNKAYFPLRRYVENESLHEILD